MKGKKMDLGNMKNDIFITAEAKPEFDGLNYKRLYIKRRDEDICLDGEEIKILMDTLKGNQGSVHHIEGDDYQDREIFLYNTTDGKKHEYVTTPKTDKTDE